jgi:RimJ/RimL family protein N-acetyltransferase
MKIYKTLPDGTQIVEYDQSLAPAIAEMWNRSGEGWGGQFGDGIWTTERAIAQQTHDAYFSIYIAMKDGEALGYCSLNRYYKDENTAYVQLLNVRPDYHGKGIGKELILLCVKETIALGMPRLDIHTWPGNTKAMPMYKKCGFLWEDRSDTTHLSNFIPTVLATELLADFFEKADWYSDSSRKIDIKPDGRKTDKFELFKYEWEKDGLSLCVGFEKTGRRIWLVETDDYKIEMTAENHELAFGLGYRCLFSVENKTGKTLNVVISGKSDGVISFDGSWAESVAEKAVFEGLFHIGEITREQDKMRMHPCVLADVRVNGKHVEFGLGIEPKFPIEVSLAEKRLLAVPGNTEDVYINIKNNLPNDAIAKFRLPENHLSRFEKSEFEIKLTKGKNAMLHTKMLVTGCGYEGVPVRYDIELDSNETTSFTRPLHIVNQGLEGIFVFETTAGFGAANGLWRLLLNKQDNTVNLDRLIPSGHAEFEISKLGKPFSDEFDIVEPNDIRITPNGASIKLEVEFKSGKFDGAVLTEIYELDSAGTLKRCHHVSNEGNKPLTLTLQTQYWTSVGRRAVLHYDGDFHEVSDNMIFGFDSFSFEKIDENWVFDSSPDNPAGIYWPKQYKPSISWGDFLKFTIPVGELQPGQSFETEPFVYMSGVFKNYHEFRNYVLGVYDEKIPTARNHLELVTNGGNPVLSNETLTLTVFNNRQKSWEGFITASSPDGLFAEISYDIPEDDIHPEAVITTPIAPNSSGIGLASVSLHLSGFEKDLRRAFLITDNSQIQTQENDGTLTVKNGEVRFSVTPGYCDALHSFYFGEDEWLFSGYPSHEPYSWWNPFVGGLYTVLERMNNRTVLKEKITACFDSATDVFGNVWTGIRADVSIEHFDEYKGKRYSQYYLTLPGAPVMCHFTKLENGTGYHTDTELCSMLFLSGKDRHSTTVATTYTDDNTEYRLRFSGDGHEMPFGRLVRVERDGENKRAEKLYVYKDSVGDRGKNDIDYDLNIAFCAYSMKSGIPNGSHYTTKPMFLILTEKELTPEALSDLSRIEFR